jgi:MFS superfamily sulfate permease-like transporter
MRTYPSFGSLPRSRFLVNIGGKTAIAHLIAGVIVLICYFTLSHVVQFLPRASLSSIVFPVALKLIDLKEIGFVFMLR